MSEESFSFLTATDERRIFDNLRLLVFCFKRDMHVEKPASSKIEMPSNDCNFRWSLSLLHYCAPPSNWFTVEYRLLNYVCHSDTEVYAQVNLFTHYDAHYNVFPLTKLDITNLSLPIIKKNRINCPIPSTQKHIRCHFEVHVIQKIVPDKPILKLSDDLEALLADEASADIAFIFEEKEIKAHKLILSARNQVFAKMFASDMIEKKSNKIEIEDIASDIFHKLLHFIYTGKMSISDIEKLTELLFAADKYDISDLKSLCEQDILKNLSVDNAPDILVAAHKLSLENFKSKIMNFIFANKSKIIETDGYKNLVKSHFYLVDEMFQKIRS